MRAGRPAGGARRGAAAVEMALLLPFLAFLFFVAVDYSRAYRAAQVVDTAARAGAMYASGASGRDPNGGRMTDAAIQAAVTEGAGLNPPLQTKDVAVTSDANGVTVTVTYSFSTLTGYAGAADGWVITRSTTIPAVPQPPGAR